jgi:hypothetical protein
MKTIIFLLLLSTTSAWAGKCRITGAVSAGMDCYRITTSMAVDSVEACEAFAKSTRDNRFFNIMEKKEILLSSKFSFKERGSKKVSGKFHFDDNVNCN